MRGEVAVVYSLTLNDTKYDPQIEMVQVLLAEIKYNIRNATESTRSCKNCAVTYQTKINLLRLQDQSVPCEERPAAQGNTFVINI